MSFNAREKIVDREGVMTLPFARELDRTQNGVLVCLQADLAKIKPEAGAVRWVKDINKAAFGTGSAWVTATGGAL